LAEPAQVLELLSVVAVVSVVAVEVESLAALPLDVESLAVAVLVLVVRLVLRLLPWQLSAPAERAELSVLAANLCSTFAAQARRTAPT
jgi:hypothetical protein